MRNDVNLLGRITRTPAVRYLLPTDPETGAWSLDLLERHDLVYFWHNAVVIALWLAVYGALGWAWTFGTTQFVGTLPMWPSCFAVGMLLDYWIETGRWPWRVAQDRKKNPRT